MEARTAMANASRAPYSRLESLHTELLELVCCYVARMADLTHSRFRCINQTPEIQCDTAGREDLKALRLVSRRFATLHTPCEGLFRDFHLLVTPDSIARLEGVASHPRLRNYVSRVTFFPPLFYRSQTDYLEFQDSLERQVEHDFLQKLPTAGWSHHERCAMVSGLLEHCFPYSPRQVGDAWTAYCELYDSQQRLLEDPSFTGRVATSLSACPRITAAFLPLRDPYRSPHYFDVKSLEPSERVNRQDWMAKYHPEVLQRTSLWEPMDSGSLMKAKAHRHFNWATRILAQANLQLQELVTDEHQGFSPSFDWGTLIHSSDNSTNTRASTLDVSNFRRLHLTPLPEDGELTDQDWSHNLSPLLKQTANLTELSLRFGQMQAEHQNDNSDGADALEKHHRPPTFHGLYDRHFPRLRELHLEWLRFDGKQMAHFISSHPSLQSITLGSVSAEDAEWRSVFDAIRAHPGIVDVELCDLRRAHVNVPEHVCVSSVSHKTRVPGCSVEPLSDLSRYIFGNGCWTADLAREWEG